MCPVLCKEKIIKCSLCPYEAYSKGGREITLSVMGAMIWKRQLPETKGSNADVAAGIEEGFPRR